MSTLTSRGAQLQGRTVLVTGASGGLGERFARIAAAQGANVVLAARRFDRLAQVAGELRDSGLSATAVAMDVVSQSSTAAAFDHAESEFGTVDSVIANAGIEKSGPSVAIAPDDFEKVFNVNVKGVFLTACEAARRLQQAEAAARGRIVLISSITARKCYPGAAPYSASKAAVSHLGRLLACEWARTGPNVICVSPGYIASDLVADWFASEGGQKQLRSFPRRKLVEEDGLDGIVLHLLSDAAKSTTGADIVVDEAQSL